MPTKAELEDKLDEMETTLAEKTNIIEGLEQSVAALSDKIELFEFDAAEADAVSSAPVPPSAVTEKTYVGAVQTPSVCVIGDARKMADKLSEPIRGAYVVDYSGPGAATEAARQRVFRSETLEDGTVRVHYANVHQAAQEARRSKILREAAGDHETEIHMSHAGHPALRVIDAARGGKPVMGGGVLSVCTDHVNIFSVQIDGKKCLLLELE